MRKFKIASGIVIVSLTMAAALVLTPANTRTLPTSAAVAEFDHSNCQYPYRWSNPVDGCDNSDPAVPECIKSSTTQEAEQTCIAEFVRQYEVESGEQVDNPPTVPATPSPTVNTCGGK